MWTRFSDMYSGGSKKTLYDYLYIEAEQHAAVNAFTHIFGEHPYSVSCNCCGQDFSVREASTLEDASEFERGEVPLESYITVQTVKVVYSRDIPQEYFETEAVEPYYQDDEDYD